MAGAFRLVREYTNKVVRGRLCGALEAPVRS